MALLRSTWIAVLIVRCAPKSDRVGNPESEGRKLCRVISHSLATGRVRWNGRRGARLSNGLTGPKVYPPPAYHRALFGRPILMARGWEPRGHSYKTRRIGSAA